MKDGVLTVKGERTQESKEEKDGYRRVERMSGSFSVVLFCPISRTPITSQRIMIKVF
jgi:Molecular chaperone (small heat shock protein)